MLTPASIPFAALTPCASAATLWQRRGRLGLTFVVKATFSFEPDRAAQLTEPLAVVPRDRHYDKTPTGSVEAASELAPFLPGAGVVLTGHAQAPAGQGAVPSLSARLALVRDQVLLDKTVHVYGDRSPARPSECDPFRLLPLRWELAVGGSDHPDHPVGAGTACVPNLIHGADPTKPGGFGPVGWDWPVRRRLLGSFDRRQLMARVPEFPDGFDWRYFNPAPGDQQLGGYLQGDEWIVLQGMSPLAPQVRTRLPSARAEARAVMITPKGPRPPEPIPLVADLLIIDADRELCSVVWRGNRVLAHEESELPLVGVLAGVATAGRSIPWPAEGDLGPLHDVLMAADAAQPAAIVERELGPSGPRAGVDGPIFLDLPGLGPSRPVEPAGAVHDGTAEPPAVSMARPVPPAEAAPMAPSTGHTPSSGPTDAARSRGEAVAATGSDDPPPSAPSSSSGGGLKPVPPVRKGDDIPTVTTAPYDVATAAWQIKPPQDALIVIVKGSYDIVPGEAAKPRQEPDFCVGEGRHDDDPEGSCVYPDDYAIFKPKTDVVMTGMAHAPHGPATAMQVTFRFGHEGNHFDKTVTVQGDRRWERSLGRAKPSEPEPFETLPLVYERAYGGPKVAQNPAGTGQGKSEQLPNLELPGKPITSPSDKAEPACFAPIAMDWSDRWRKMGTYTRKWLATRWPYYPDDFDWTYYQAAPADQQLELPLRGDEPFQAEGVHPELRELDGSLPGERPRCFAVRRDGDGGGLEEVDLRLDTAVFDFVEMKLNLIWRGFYDVRADDAPEVQSLFTLRQRLDEPALTEQEVHERYLVAITPLPVVEDHPDEPAPEPANETEAEQDAELAAADAKLAAQVAAQEEQLREQLRAAGIDPDAPPPQPEPPDPVAIAAMLREAGATPGEIDEVVEAVEESIAAGEEESEETPAAPDPVPAMRDRVIAMLEAGESFEEFDFEQADLSDLDFSERCLARANLHRATMQRTCFDRASLVEAQLGEADLSESSLVEADLTGADLFRAKLPGARLDGALLTDLELEQAVGRQASFEHCRGYNPLFCEGDWTGARFRSANLELADFSAACLEGADFTAAEVPNINLRGVQGREAIFDGAKMAAARGNEAQLPDCSLELADAPDAVFENAVLDEARLRGANLQGSSFVRAACRRADFSHADLTEARLARADLRGANLLQANLMMADLESADLGLADLRGANLHSAGLWKAELEDAKLDAAIITKSTLVMRPS